MRWTWLVDPDLRAVEVYEAIDGRPTRVAGAEETRSIALPPFDAESDLARYWSPRTRGE